MSNFYLIYGIDKSIVSNKVNDIITQLNIKDIVKYNGDNNIKDIIEDASTISMFSNNKVIIVNDITCFKANKTIENIELLEKYLEHYNKNNYIIFTCYTDKIDSRKKIYKLINKNGKVIDCNLSKDNNYFYEYVSNYLNINNYKMEDIRYFLKKSGNNLNNIKNELDKLFMLTIDSKKINNSDIDKVVMTSMDDEIFALTDAIIAKNVNKSLELLKEFLNKNYDEIQIIILLATQFRFLLQVKMLLNKNKRYDEIAKILEVNPYRVKFTINKLYNYTEDDLVKYIKSLGKIDHDIKLGIIDKKLALELFIVADKKI